MPNKERDDERNKRNEQNVAGNERQGNRSGGESGRSSGSSSNRGMEHEGSKGSTNTPGSNKKKGSETEDSDTE